MQKNKLIIIILIFLTSSSFSWAQETKNIKPIDIIPLYNELPDEQNVNTVLFSLLKPYLENIIASYNSMFPLEQDKIDKVFISHLFKSRVQERKHHFDYITAGKGIINFIKVYDKYNTQFVVQFLHIVMPVLATPKATKQLLGNLNKSLDRTLKNSFKNISKQYISTYSLQRLDLEDLTNFTNAQASINEIAKDASSYYDLDKEFIKNVKMALQQKIQEQYRTSKEVATLSAQTNFNDLLVSEILRLIQPEITKQGKNLFEHPTIGKELTEWFKTAPAFGTHSLVGVTDEQLSNLNNLINSGQKFQFAVDLDMQKNKNKNGISIWDVDNKNNTLEKLQQALIKTPNIKVGNSYIAFMPDKMIISSSEKAIHIELVVSKIPLSPSQLITAMKDKATLDFSAPTQEPNSSANIMDEANIDKTFEMPNKDSKIEGKSRNFNIKTYKTILGDTYTGENKSFEEKAIPKMMEEIEPKTNTEDIKEELQKDKIDNNMNQKNDEDLDEAIDETL